MRSSLLVRASIVVAVASALTAAQEPEPPGHRSIKTEKVNVRLVTLDVVVFDRDDRTVPALVASDFELIVDGRRVGIDTFDAACPSGGLEAPRAGWTDRWSEAPAGGDEPRRVIFVFDYLHLTQVRSSARTAVRTPYFAIRQLARALRSLPEAREEIMIAVLDGGLRVEQPFTSDRARTLQTLSRMENDVTLYAGHFDHPSEYPLFTGLNALVDVVDTIPGSKAAVIFTGGHGPGMDYDAEYRALGNHASLARVAFYPVDCSGLREGEFTGYPFR